MKRERAPPGITYATFLRLASPASSQRSYSWHTISVWFSPRGCSLGSEMDKRCPQCEEPLIEFDHYGELLIGCIVCNWWVGEDEVPKQLDEADIATLRGRVRPN